MIYIHLGNKITEDKLSVIKYPRFKRRFIINYKHDKMERKIDLRLNMYYFADSDSAAQRKSYVLLHSRWRASRNFALSLMPSMDKRSSMLRLPN